MPRQIDVRERSGARAHGQQPSLNKGCFEAVRRALDCDMTKGARNPIAILAQASKAHLVREVALQLKVTYEELPVLGKPDLIRFRFPPMSNEDEHKLVFAVPGEAYCQGVFIGSADPRELDL